MIKKINLIVLFIVIVCTGCTFLRFDKDREIARNGKSKYSIVISGDASPSTIHGALELQMFLHTMTGAVLPIHSDRLPMKSREIILGDSEHLRKLIPALDLEKLGDEGYMIKTMDNYLIIAGGERRGNMYGVYGLLDDHLGCRWFTPEVSHIPVFESLIIPELDEKIIPLIDYREPYVWEAFDGDWAARNRMNRNSKDGGLRIRHGGKIEWVPEMFVHTFEKLVPPDEYFRKHPEYFSQINGKRRKTRSQLCCTNKNVVKIVTEGVLKAFRENPQADVLSVSQNDWENYCQCKKCSSLAKREESQVAPVLQMVNSVAKAVEEEFPGKTIETLAYQWTRTPPKTIRPRHNVVIRLCTIECCFSHPLDSCDSEANREFVSDLELWSDITDRIWIWNYVTSFSHYFVPYPNLRVRDDNIRLFVRNNVTAVFQQDVYTTPNGELSGLSGYLNARLLWNPDYDEDEAINEFLEGVYGAAAPSIRAYIDMIHDKVEDENIHIGIWQSPDSEYLSDDIIDRADSLWDQAEAAVAGNPVTLKRVKTARLSPDYALIWRDRTRGDALLADHKQFRLDVNPAFTSRVERFCQTANQAGVIKLREYGYSVNEFREDMEKQVTSRSLTVKQPENPKTTVQGLTRRLYSGNWSKLPKFESLKHTRSETVKRFGLPVIDESGQAGIRFEGYISIPRDGVYTFYTRTAGGSKLFIGETDVVGSNYQNGIHERQGYCALKAGKHRIMVTYITREEPPVLEVFWQGPGINKQRIPESALYVKVSAKHAK